MRRAYESDPCYPTVGGRVCRGWPAAAATLGPEPLVVAVDGPAVLDWSEVAERICSAIEADGRTATRLDVRASCAPWPEVVRRTSSARLADDPHFEHLATGGLKQLFDRLPSPVAPTGAVLVVFGPGAALVHHDVLWYVDLPKRYAEAEVSAGRGRNLGQGECDGPPTTRRLFYVDWPLLDRHRDAVCAEVDRWFDVQDPSAPVSVDGSVLRQTLRSLAGRPFRTRPTFNTTPWGGHWAQRELGMNRDAPNTALGYELIAPESGVLCGDDGGRVELPFALVVARHAEEVLGHTLQERFGGSFPIRFDYLDTVGGGNLSVHCHPQQEYMSSVFGWPYTQHETYYMMVGGDQSRVYLGLRGDADVAGFLRDAERAHDCGTPFDIEQHVQSFPAVPHQLFCVPAGTPHGSGVGNVVLEISATPYLYSLRFYDWLRRDAHGRQRAVHVGHAFANLDADRRGQRVAADLVQAPRRLREGAGWHEELLGALPEMFFEVRRMVLESDEPAEDEASDRFHVLGVVEGDGIRVETADGTVLDLAYAETAVVPASCGRYRLHRVGRSRVRVLKALVC